MRILLDYRPALRERTGVGEYVHELTRALAGTSTADEIAILSASWKDRPAPGLATALPGVRIIDRRIPVRPLTWCWNRLGFPPVEWLAGAFDVVHAQSPLLIPSRAAARVITIHDLDFLKHPDRFEAEMRRDFPQLVRQHAHRADRIVVSSHYAAGEVVTTLGVSADKVSVCSPGAPSWTRDVAQTRGEGTHLLFVGTIEPRKNIARLLDAYALVREWRPDAPPLVLAGRIRDSMRHELERTDRAPLAGHVQVRGYVSERARRELYRDACLLVLPSLEEGFGLPLLEAMACGVPVVISNRGSLPEVAGAAANPVDPEDVGSIAREIHRLLGRDASQDAIERGLAQATKFSWSSCATATRQAYGAAIAARARRAK